MKFKFGLGSWILGSAGANVLAVPRIDSDRKCREKASGVKFRWSDKNFNAHYSGIDKTSSRASAADPNKPCRSAPNSGRAALRSSRELTGKTVKRIAGGKNSPDIVEAEIYAPSRNGRN